MKENKRQGSEDLYNQMLPEEIATFVSKKLDLDEDLTTLLRFEIDSSFNEPDEERKEQIKNLKTKVGPTTSSVIEDLVDFELEIPINSALRSDPVYLPHLYRMFDENGIGMIKKKIEGAQLEDH